MVISGPTQVLAVSGKADFSRLPQITASLEATLLQKPARLIIDLSKACEMDCSVFALLMTAMQSAAEYGGKFLLAGIPDNVRGIFEKSRLRRRFSIYPDVNAALSAP